MRQNILILLVFVAIQIFPKFSVGQSDADSTLNIVDDIQFDLKSASYSKDTLIIELFVISYDKNPREFRLNVFGSTLQDSLNESHMFTSIQMGRVILDLQSKQNYLNYLLYQDKPVSITLKINPWNDQKIQPKEVKLVFSSLEEEGQFLEARIELETQNQELVD